MHYGQNPWQPTWNDYLTTMAWPGNVRQLENLCRWLTVMASGNEIQIDDLPPELREGPSRGQAPVTTTGRRSCAAGRNAIWPPAKIRLARCRGAALRAGHDRDGSECLRRPAPGRCAPARLGAQYLDPENKRARLAVRRLVDEDRRRIQPRLPHAGVSPAGYWRAREAKASRHHE